IAPAVAAVTTIAARTVGLLGAADHDGRGSFLELVDADGEETDDVFVDRHRALQLLDGSRRGIDVEQGVVTLAVLLDAIGEGTQAPVLLLGDGATEPGDQVGELGGQGLHLRRRDVLTRNEDILIECHETNGSLWLLATRS